MKYHKKAICSISLIILFSVMICATAYAQVDPDDFVIGLYQVQQGNFWDLKLHDIGLLSQYNTGINVVQSYLVFGHYYYLGYDGGKIVWGDTTGHGDRIKESLDYVEMYIDSALYYGFDVMLGSQYWYEERRDVNAYTGICSTFTDTTKFSSDSLHYFMSYDSLYSFLRDDLTVSQKNAIWGFYLADEPSTGGCGYDTLGHTPKLFNVPPLLPDERLHEAYEHFDSLYNDNSVKFTIALGASGYYPELDDEYWDDADILLVSCYAYHEDNYWRKLEHVESMVGAGKDVQPIIGVEALDKPQYSYCDNSRRLATLYRMLQLEVEGIWFYSLRGSYTKEEDERDDYQWRYDNLSTLFADTVCNLTMEIDTLVDMEYLPFDDNGSLTVRKLNYTSVSSDSVVVRYTDKGNNEVFIIAVNQSGIDYKYLNVYLPDVPGLKPDREDYATVLFESSSHVRGYQNSHATAIDSNAYGEHISDNFEPWSAHVYIVPYCSGGGDQKKLSAAGLPKEFALKDAYPNPFNPATGIEYDLPEHSEVAVTIYNILGQKVRTLVNTVQAAGTYKVDWDGKNDYGIQLSSGVYIVRMETPKYSGIRKITLLKE